MSNENHEPATWTFASLREYLLRVVADLAAKQSQLSDAQDKAIQAALVAQEKAVQAALAAADKAVLKAEEGAQRWQESANEWRGAMSDRERSFVPRTEYAQAHGVVEAAIAELKERTTVIEGLSRGIAVQKTDSHNATSLMIAGFGALLGVSGVVIAGISLAMK